MSLEDFLSKLDSKTAKNIKTASETKIVRHALASRGITWALGGGIAAGRVITVFGNNSAGKSLLFTQSVGEWQKEGLVCGWADAEGTYDKAFGARLGVNNDELILVNKKSTGAMTDTIIPLIEGGIDILVLDSISDLLPEVFVEDNQVKDFADMKQIGAHAKSITQMINAIHYANEKTAVVLLSQTTTDLSGMHPEQKPHGGKKIEFGSSQMVRLSSSPSDTNQIKGQIQAGDRLIESPIGREVDWFVKKNKLGRSHGKGKYNMYYAGDFIGIDKVGELVSLAETFGVITKGGAWYKYKDSQYQGSNNLVKALKQDLDFMKDMEIELQLAMTGEVVERV